MASKLWVHEPDTFFLQADTEISEKRNFFVNRSVPENFQRGNFSGQVPTESLSTQDSEYLYERGVETCFESVSTPQSWEIPVKRDDLPLVNPNTSDHAVIGSYRIWLARNCQEWSAGELITVKE